MRRRSLQSNGSGRRPWNSPVRHFERSGGASGNLSIRLRSQMDVALSCFLIQFGVGRLSPKTSKTMGIALQSARSSAISLFTLKYRN